ncbi:GNAT family N-acetyltransferase [bacterium]|nr:GNAT family N-acetyltransferase [bacterium]
MSEIETFEGYRGRGVASQMLDEVKHFGQEHGASRIYGDNDNKEFWNHMQEQGWRTEGNHVIYDLNASSNTEAVDGNADLSVGQSDTDSTAGSDTKAGSHPEMGKKGDFVTNTLASAGLAFVAVGNMIGLTSAEQIRPQQPQSELHQQAAQQATQHSGDVCDTGSNSTDSTNQPTPQADAHDAGEKLEAGAGAIGDALEQRRRNQDALKPKPQDTTLVIGPPDDKTPDPQVSNATTTLLNEQTNGNSDMTDTQGSADTSPEDNAGSSDTFQKTMHRSDVSDNDSEPIVNGEAYDVVDGSAEGTPNTSDIGQNSDQQIGAAVDSLRQLDGLRPEVWQELTPEERTSTLQEVETRMSEMQGRTPLPIRTEQLGAGSFGYYDGGSITINADHVAGNEMPVQEFVDTIVHEGRHAFQDHAIKTPGVVEESLANTWQENMDNYLSAEEVGQEAYANQPVEADAWNYASNVTNGLYGGK